MSQEQLHRQPDPTASSDEPVTPGSRTAVKNIAQRLALVYGERAHIELGRAGVNITDMALYPAPDMNDGVIALWIAGEEQARRTEELVGRLGFPVDGRDDLRT